MLTVRRVRAAYRRIGFRPASAVYFDETQSLCCPTIAVCLAEGRLSRAHVREAMSPTEVARALGEPTLYLAAFIDSINRWHTTGWAWQAAFYNGRRLADADPALALMRRGWRDGTHVGTALFGRLPQRRHRKEV